MGYHYNSFINSRDMGRMLDVGGPVVHYLDDGSGPPLLFLHGLGFSLFTFRRNFPFFVQGMRVLAPDLPGCGYSTLPMNYGGSPEDMAKYLKSFLDLTGVEKAVVCGAGEGGVYALELACRYPQCVSALILSSPGSLTRHFPANIRHLLNPVLGDFIINAMGTQHITAFMKWCYFNEISVDNYIVRQVYQPFENRLIRRVLLKLLKQYDDRFVHENLAKVKCPTLIVWGSGDPGRPCGIAEMYKKEMPIASVHLINNCGILPHEEKHKEFNETVYEFLRTVLPELRSEEVMQPVIEDVHETADDYYDENE
jgi:pimeloyl-ACP methyl ester carboxylesterase